MLKIIFGAIIVADCNNGGLQSEQLGSGGRLLANLFFTSFHNSYFYGLCSSIRCSSRLRRADGSHCCYLGRAVITVNPPSKAFPQDNYCFSDSSCRPCPSLFAQNILLPAIFLGQARATHVTSSRARRQEKMDLGVSKDRPAAPRCAAPRVPNGCHQLGASRRGDNQGCRGTGLLPCWKMSLLPSSVESIITGTSWHVIYSFIIV